MKSNRGDVLVRQECDATLSWRLLLTLWLVALALRLPGVWLFPNADGDAYSYAETIGTMSEKMIQGTFSFSDLFGFWLPLYQVTSAVVASLLHLSPLLAGKLVSACCAAGSAVIVYSLTLRIARNHIAAWIAFAFLLFDPLHAFLSGLSLTDVPNAFLVLASMHSAACGHWRKAAAWAAFAELVRIDSWILLLLLPALQFIWERRVSRAAIVLLLIGPALWLVVSFIARGDAFAYFAERAQYVESYLRFDPRRRGFGLFALKDVGNLFIGAHMIVLPLALVASGLLLARARKCIFAGERSSVTSLAPLVVASYFCALLGFLAVAYLSRSQPVIWLRYGLIFFVIGLPLAAWMLDKSRLGRQGSPSLRCFAWASLVAICAAQVVLELHWIVSTAQDDGAHRRIAMELRHIAEAEGWAGPPGLSEGTRARCFCDDPAVRLLSGLPTHRFLRTSGNENVASLVDLLYRHKAKYLVFARAEHSLPTSFYPELGTAVQAPPPFTLVRREPSPSHYGPDLWLYRVELPGAGKF